MKRVFKKLYKCLKKENRIIYSFLIKIKKKWFGNSYGGFYIAESFLNKDSIIYSVGIGEDISFDINLINEYGCLIYAFDPTPKSISWVKKYNKSENFLFFDYGLANKTGFYDFHLPINKNHVSGSIVNHENLNDFEKVNVLLKSFNDITDSFKHKHINVLKMDIEGSEYSIIDDILNSGIIIDQILLEFHSRFFDDGIKMTSDSINKIRNKGYEVFGISESFEEISFIRKDLLKNKI